MMAMHFLYGSKEVVVYILEAEGANDGGTVENFCPRG